MIIFLMLNFLVHCFSDPIQSSIMLPPRHLQVIYCDIQVPFYTYKHHHLLVQCKFNANHKWIQTSTATKRKREKIEIAVNIRRPLQKAVKRLKVTDRGIHQIAIRHSPDETYGDGNGVVCDHLQEFEHDLCPLLGRKKSFWVLNTSEWLGFPDQKSIVLRVNMTVFHRFICLISSRKDLSGPLPAKQNNKLNTYLVQT